MELACSPAQYGRHGFSESHLLNARPIHVGAARCTRAKTIQIVDEIVAKIYRRGHIPLADVPPEVFVQLMADQQEAVRAGGKGITFDLGILTRDWGFPLEKIRTRVSMWHGAEDNLAPLALARYVAEHIPGSVIKVIPNAGHAGTYACADEVLRTLIQ